MLLEEQQQRPGEMLGQIAMSMGLVTDDQLAQGLAEQMGMQVVSLSDVVIPPEVLTHITEPMAQLARSPSRMDLIGRFLPHYEGGRCRAIDAFRGDGRQPAIYAMRVERDFETWHVVGIFNLDDQYEDFELDLEPIAGKGAFHVFEYWNQEYLGRRRGTLAVRDVPAHGCKILSIRRATGRPQLVGSGMHILQGAVDIAECGFDRDTLRIAVVHPVQKDRTLFIWRPSSRILSGVKTNARDYLVDARDKRILRIHFNGRRRTEFELRWKRTNAR